MINEKTITKAWKRCYGCSKTCNGNEEFIYSLSMMQYTAEHDYYRNIEFKNVTDPEDKSLFRTADIIFCEPCWKAVAGKDYCFNKDDLDLSHNI